MESGYILVVCEVLCDDGEVGWSRERERERERERGRQAGRQAGRSYRDRNSETDGN